MNAPILIDSAALRAFVANLFAAAGMAPADADQVARSLTWAELHGHAGHGVSRVPLYLEFIAKGFLDPTAVPDVKQVKPSLLIVDGNRAAGAVTMAAAVDALAERARATGIAFALVRQTSHTGAIGLFASQLAEAGFAALIGAAGPPLMAYHGAAAQSVSTSPLAVAVPRGEGEAPIVLDMATSVAAMGRIVAARRTGKPIPEDWALTREGAPTTDAEAAALLLPLGGPKGSGLSLMMELMAGVLAGNPIVAPTIADKAARAAGFNGLQNVFMLAVDIEAYRPLIDFRRDAEELAATIKGLPRRPGFDDILLPGERGARTAAQREAQGIPLPGPIWQSLVAAAKEKGIDVPNVAETPPQK